MEAKSPWPRGRWFAGAVAVATSSRIYPDKPPLYFWAAAGVAELRGGRFDEVSARLPAVLGGLASLVFTLALGEALFGARTGLVSAVVLATSGLFFWYARQGHPDQFLIAGVTLACLALWRSFTAARGPRRTAWVALAYAAMALAGEHGLLGLVLRSRGRALPRPDRAAPRGAPAGRLWPAFRLRPGRLAGGPAVSRYGLGYFARRSEPAVRVRRSWVHTAPGNSTSPRHDGFLP